jgi:hypothetical protein
MEGLMHNLKEALVGKGVSAEKLNTQSDNTVLPDSVFDSLTNIGGGDDENTRIDIDAFGRVFGRIRF